MPSPTRADTDFSDEILTPEAGVTSFDHFFSKTVAFEQALASAGCIEPTDPDTGFEDLVVKDLSPAEKAIAHHAAKLRVTGTSWTPTNDITGETPVEEPDSTLDDSDSSSSSTLHDEDPVLQRSSTQDKDSWKLEPKEVIDLLIEEFGPLAADDEEEKLILEVDAGFIKDVTILGVVHLTTHRLSFHASLMAARPDLRPEQQIIKTGSVILHRKGWRSKRRLWMELSHDMLCSYASSSDRIRPIRTTLLSAIQEVLPLDPKQPKYVRIVFESKYAVNMRGIAEFDTVEAASDWKRELTNAVFLYRHRRRRALDGSDEERDSGIRMNCPLGRITAVGFHDPILPHLASISILHQFGVTRTIQVGPMPRLKLDAWQKLPDHLAAFKKMRLANPSRFDDTPVFVDLGPLSFEDAVTDVETTNVKEKAVRAALALGAESNIWITKGSVYRTIASKGYFIVSDNYICFWSKYFTQDDIRYRLPASSVLRAKPFSLVCGYGLTLEIEGHHDLRFQFRASQLRDEAATRVNAVVNEYRENTASVHSSDSSTLDSGSVPATPTRSLTRSATGVFAPLERSLAAAIANGPSPRILNKLPKPINLPREVLIRRQPKHFFCLTIGSRGDVQPYIALGLGLMKEGHTVTIVTHDEYKEWIEGFGIHHKQAGGDPGALMKLSVENKMFSPEFFKESIQNFRPWLDQLLIDSWESCQGAEILLESPSTMSGVHIAEALNIPYFRTFTMPWTKTAEFPHAFLSPPVEAPTFNSASYVLFSNVMWAATSGQINRWRKNTLGIRSTDMGHLAQSKIPFIYNFSTAVVPKPLDWGDATTISGYWFLDNPDGANWTPPAGLVEWMTKAREDGKPIVYIGFGSITVPHPNRVTARIVKAVLKSGVRAIISKGWSARMSSSDTKDDPEVEIPPECYQLDKVPHDWLFPQIDAAVHHGGAGTTGASLRAGIPTLIKPWFGDQYFWASRVQKLGAGLRVPSLHLNDFSEALVTATTSRVMKEKAAAVGEKIRAEDGVHTAIHTIYTYLEHSSSYIKHIRRSRSVDCPLSRFGRSTT